MNAEQKEANRLEAALAILQKRIAAGWEYPDAHAFCATSFKVDGDALRDAYDLACMNVKAIS